PATPAIRTDPAGRATSLLQAAAEHLAARRFDAAVEALAICLDETPDVVVALRDVPGRSDLADDLGAARPARRLAALGASRLGAASGERLVRRDEDLAATLLRRAADGDREALFDVASRRAMTRAGDAALLVAGESAVESGDYGAAVAALRM